MIKHRSTRMQKLMRAYMDDKIVYYHTYRARCERCRSSGWCDWHHVRGRSGTLLFDRRFIKDVCRDCHIWIENNPAKARVLGLLCGKGLWGQAPKDAVTEEIRQRMIEICKK